MHLPIATTCFSTGDGLSEKTVSAVYAFLDMHILLANYGVLSCHLAPELYCLRYGWGTYVLILPPPLQLPILDMPAGWLPRYLKSVCADLCFVVLLFKY